MTQRLVLWWGFAQVFGRKDLGQQPLTDADFARLKSMGVDGLVAQTQFIQPESYPTYTFLMDQAIDLNGAARAKAAGIDVWLGYYAESRAWPSGPFVNGWDTSNATLNDRWNHAAEYMRLFAKWARDHGCIGVAQDGEGAPVNGVSPGWNVPTVPLDQVRQRGAQIAAGIAAGFPGLELLSYYGDFPGSYQERTRKVSTPSYSASNLVHKDFWLGMAQEPGIGSWEFWEAVPFYYNVGDASLTWNQAVAEHISKFGAYWQTKLTPAQLSKVGTTPFMAPGKFDTKPAASTPDQFATQLQAATQGFRSIACYTNGMPTIDSWTPYASAMQSASGVQASLSSDVSLFLNGAAQSGGTVTVTLS